ncbi:MAG: ABC transporter ATP-binding protein [Deltaproteobacteria bacterium]|nr:ABC transporter ATP-binding protein [Deltaproteobacteria bacterium]
MAGIELDRISKHYGDTVILEELSLAINEGELVVLVGPSGCGKTTILRMIAGLLEPSRGRIRIDGRDVTETLPGERDIAMVFQSYALYPHMTVFENVAFPLRVRRLAPGEISRRVNEVTKLLGIDHLLGRKPAALSGGQRQRVAMGRAIVREPKAFLFDEPLSNLDAALRGRMRGEIAGLHRRLGATMVYVTHDQHEAMTLADRLVLLNKGKIEQMGRPLDVYREPKTRFVAEFIGSPPMNFVPVEERAGSLAGAGFAVPLSAVGVKSGVPGGRLLLGVRPEALKVATSGEALPTLKAEIDWIERTGSDGYLYARVGPTSIVARLSAAAGQGLSPGQRVDLSFSQARLFDEVSGRAVDDAGVA